MPSLEHVPTLAPPRRPAGPWGRWAGALLDLVLPPFCPVCQVSLDEDRRGPLCARCWVALERLAPPWCRCCGKPLLGYGNPETIPTLSPSEAIGWGAVLPGPGSQAGPAPWAARGEGPLCGACRRRPPAFAYARAAARYDPVVREAIHAFKFRGRRGLAAPLGDLLLEVVGENLPLGLPDLLVPVPLHRRRARERGFNQALLLAHRLGRAWGLPVRDDVLLRAVATPSQTALEAPARRANVRGAFRLRRPEAVAGRHVAVVDDILTTGATVSECTRCLVEAGGAAVVGVLTVARVLPR